LKREVKTWEHIVATLFVYCTTAGIAIIFPNVIAAFSFIGGTCCVFIMIIFPMWIKAKQGKNKKKNLLLMIAIYVLSIPGFFAAIISLLDAFNVIHINPVKPKP